jgi:hypothetical protein
MLAQVGRRGQPHAFCAKAVATLKFVVKASDQFLTPVPNSDRLL